MEWSTAPAATAAAFRAVFSHTFATVPTGGTQNAPHPLVGWREDTLFPFLTLSVPRSCEPLLQKP